MQISLRIHQQKAVVRGHFYITGNWPTGSSAGHFGVQRVRFVVLRPDRRQRF